MRVADSSDASCRLELVAAVDPRGYEGGPGLPWRGESAMIRPVIGISTYREPADWGQWRGVPATLLPARYAASVSSGGATPVLLPPMGIADDIPGVVQRLDGLIVAGGSDVNPSRYGELPRHAGHGRARGRQAGPTRPRPGGARQALSWSRRVRQGRGDRRTRIQVRGDPRWGRHGPVPPPPGGRPAS